MDNAGRRATPELSSPARVEQARSYFVVGAYNRFRLAQLQVAGATSKTLPGPSSPSVGTHALRRCDRGEETGAALPGAEWAPVCRVKLSRKTLAFERPV